MLTPWLAMSATNKGLLMDRLAAMETLVAVIESGSFSAAARRLHVGQPAVSKMIAQLEARLETRLLVRSTRGLTATEAGQAFYERALRAIEEADEADLLARDAGAGLVGRLRVCGPVTLSRLHVVPYLGRFLDAHPGLKVDVVLDDRHVDLREEGIDVALRLGNLADSSMTARRVASSRHVVLGTPAYFKAHGAPVSPAELSGHPAVVYAQPGFGGSWTLRRERVEVPVVLSPRIKLTAAEGVRAAVMADLGLAIASEWMFGPELAHGEVVRVLADWSLPPVDLWAVFPSGRLVSAKARAFVSFVEDTLAAASYGAVAVEPLR